MQHSRRSNPLPQDFITALSRSNLRSSLLEDDVAFAIPAEISQRPLQPPPTSLVPTSYTSANLFDQHESTTSTAKHANTRRYIPPHFPSFPSEHTFQATPVYTSRETDARRIREQATHEGMEAEKALRKLMAASKAAAGNRRRGVGDDAQRVRREEIWRETLEAVRMEDERAGAVGRGGGGMFGLDGAGDVMEAGIEVDYDKMFARRGRT